jgi:molybdate transport system substrate-binding protein
VLIQKSRPQAGRLSLALVALAASALAASALAVSPPAAMPAAVPLAAAGPAPEPPEIVVDAAASLRNALQAIGPACEKQAEVRLVFNFGASNDLARQILAANKADVFFSADEPLMDKVAGEGLVDAASRR